MIILLHTSKSMKVVPKSSGALSRPPALIAMAEKLDAYLKTLSPTVLAKVMAISPALAQKTHQLIADWDTKPARQSIALDSFIGDIYSGLHVSDFSASDRAYADKVLRILSGLYGVIRPLDSICPYRLEMGYRMPDPTFNNLYAFWGDKIAETLPKSGIIVNLAALEYSKVVIPYVNQARVLAPKFLTTDAATGEPTFVVVHAKIARGAFARWLIQHKITERADMLQFAELGYRYEKSLSTPNEPVFVCDEFGGKGLSVRLQGR